MVTYIQHSACTDFTIYGTCPNTNPVFKFGGNNDIEFDEDRAIMIDDDETYIGHGAGDSINGGVNNTLIGHDAGNALTTGDNNTFIGQGAGQSSEPTLTGCVLIGKEAGLNAATNNTLYINNNNSEYPLIYGEFANDTVKFGNNSNAWFFKFTVNGVTSELYGGQASDKRLKLSANDTDGADQAHIVLKGTGGNLELIHGNGDAVTIHSHDTQNVMKFWYNGGIPTIETTLSNGDLQLLPNGSGNIRFGTYAAKGAEAFDGFITIKDAAGNTRKLMTCA